MKRKKDVKVESLGAWDKYANVDATTALAQIYEDVSKSSQESRDWYWKHIAWKRKSSIVVRSTSFFLLVCGVVFPILAGIYSEVETRLLLTQCGVAVLAVAGLLQAADRIFGWSSGWLRYITTVTAMEAATRKFELDWADYLVSKKEKLTDNDKRTLFQLAKRLVEDISKMQSDETEKWVAEFNTSLALLSDLIKSQRESSERAVEAARTAVAAQEAAAIEKEKAQELGAIEISFVHKATPTEIKVHMDSDPEVSFVGTVWSKLQVVPGIHTVHVTTIAPTVLTIEKVVKVEAGGIAYAEIEIP